VLAVNGEIYNHKELKKNLKVDFEFQTHSDCEVLLALYKEKGPGFLDDLAASSPSSSMTPSRMPT
jgi:asparagine synthase (glutamine-hydrolysing)